jgi:glycosyltransferase involved in cell wall biosynthesis
VVKLIYIVSDINKSLHFEWITPYLQQRFDISYILIGSKDTELEKYLISIKVKCDVVTYTSKKDLLRVWFKVFNILRRENPHIVHTHLWIANLVGLSAARFLHVPQRILTRHHATIHYKEYPSGRKWDVLCNGWATHIIAISENVKNILIDLDKADPQKVSIIHHGFDFTYFQHVSPERIQLIRNKYKLKNDVHTPIVGVISRYTNWKGIQYIIPAFENLRAIFPSAHLILANANGDYKTELKSLLSKLPEGSYTEIAFENDLAALYHIFDVFVHVPIDPYAEAFGQTYVEPLIVGVPSVFTKSGVAREFIKDEENAIVVPFQDPQAILLALLKLLSDEALSKLLVRNGKVSVEKFTIQRYFENLCEVYSHA